jgi:hypothetical protein
MSNEALKVGELELRFVNFHVPDTFHSGLPSGPFWVLEIVPLSLDDDAALAIELHISKHGTSAGITANKICLFIKNESMKIEVKLFGFILSIIIH